MVEQKGELFSPPRGPSSTRGSHPYICCQDPNKIFFVLDDDSIAPHNFAKTLYKWYTHPDLIRPERHFYARGIAKGIHYNTTRSVLRSLNKPDQYTLKGTLETILARALWTAYRFYEPDIEHNPTCPRCSLSVEDSLHLQW